jgi:hypothetical protein
MLLLCFVYAALIRVTALIRVFHDVNVDLATIGASMLKAANPLLLGRSSTERVL